MSSGFVPGWVLDLPLSRKPCAGHAEGKPCWRVYTSNEDIVGEPDGLKQVRCPSWTPIAADFQGVPDAK